MKAPNKSATEKSPAGRQDLVNLARKILGSAGDSEAAKETSSNMSTEETEKQAESPTSRFTAVNGARDLPNGAGPSNGTNGNGPSRRESDERPNGQTQSAPARHERLTISTDQDWVPPTNGERTHLPSDRQSSHQSSNGYSEDSHAHKRKRSGSIEPGSSSANSYHNHGLPASTKQTPTTATTDSDNQTPREPRDDHRRMPSQGDHREAYSSEQQYRKFIGSNDQGRDSVNDNWHQRQQYSHHHVNSDEHIGEVLQRASQSMDQQMQQHDYDRRTLSGDDGSANPYSAYPNDRREMSAQSDPKKRKRNFSNRTKTGCMTCRRRKKKCDETRPECNNCQRGGFVCSGYQQRGQWPKTEQKQAPVPLQSKNEYDSPVYPTSSPYGNQPLGPPRREPLPGYRGQSLQLDPHHSKGQDDDHPSSAIPGSAVTTDNSRPYATQHITTPVTAGNSTYADRHRNDYQRVGPLHDMSRQERQDRQDAENGHSSRDSSLPHLLHPQQMHSENPHVTNAQQAAQLALSHPVSARPRTTQKEEMLAGRHYFPFDKELVLERERCNGACWRFNSSTNPNNGVSPEERARLFRDILQPREHVISPTQASPVTPIGRVGDNVVVEAPFNCDYGYNISIGQEVAIGKNCTILDTCEVKIGDRCNIGPNVNIYTATLPVDPKRRLGSRGPNLGRKITIDNDCWIGGGVTILPGRTIGKGSTVGAGSIVTRDVPPYTVVCGNPARVIRGVYRPQEQ